MAHQHRRVGSTGRVAEAGKGRAAGGGEEEVGRPGEKREKNGEGSSSSSSSSSRVHQPYLVAVFCDVCGDPKLAKDVCFDAIGCPHIFCFGCLSLRALTEDEGGGVLPCPVPGCIAGFLDQVVGGPPPSVAAVDGATEAEEEAVTYYCSICMERKPAGECFLDLRGCDHVFCTECIAGYVAAKVEENCVAAIRCPDPGCDAGRLEPEDCRPVIPAQVFERWGAALCEAAVGESARFYCPYKDCSALLWREDDGGSPMRDAQCGHCGRVCCAQCRVPWHEGRSCEEHRKRAEDVKEAEKVMEMAKKKQWQRCPKCGFVVERVDGCVFIRCRCNHCFCYRCGSPMDPKDGKHFCHKCRVTWDDDKKA